MDPPSLKKPRWAVGESSLAQHGRVSNKRASFRAVPVPNDSVFTPWICFIGLDNATNGVFTRRVPDSRPGLWNTRRGGSPTDQGPRTSRGFGSPSLRNRNVLPTRRRSVPRFRLDHLPKARVSAPERRDRSGSRLQAFVHRL